MTDRPRDVPTDDDIVDHEAVDDSAVHDEAFEDDEAGYDEAGYHDAGYDDAEYHDHGTDEEFELVGGEPSRVRKLLVFVLVLLAVLLVAGGASALWVMRQVDPSGPPGDEVRITVPSGSSTVAIGDLLHDGGVIGHTTVWRFYTRFKDAGPFQAGDYVFRENSAMGDAIDVLEAGPLGAPTERFTVPEGLTVAETLAALADKLPRLDPAALQAAADGGQIRSAHHPEGVADLQGFLFPETYEILAGADEAAVLARMVAQFDSVAEAIGLAESQGRVGLTPYEVLIVASLIQEEARIAADAPKIARVIYNRLDEGIALGIDATLCFLETERPCRLTTSDLEQDSPYNSRINPGLPPTPIAAPGRAALEAALAPADGPWLYYVLDPDAAEQGGHFFTDDFGEFNRKKAECEAAGLGCG